jgi:predicted transcriptional regulator
LTSSRVNGAKAEDVMEAGPTTIRPDVHLRPTLKRLTDRNLDSVLVTASDGSLIGVLYREDAQRQVGPAADAREEEACVCE